MNANIKDMLVAAMLIAITANQNAAIAKDPPSQWSQDASSTIQVRHHDVLARGEGCSNNGGGGGGGGGR